jgi:hypothetical protein
MLKLQNIHKDSLISGIEPDQVVRIMMADKVGDNALTILYKMAEGRIVERMLLRINESRLSVADSGRPWAFDAPGDQFKLRLEALRIRYALPNTSAARSFNCFFQSTIWF